jgi:hypothetical protein
MTEGRPPKDPAAGFDPESEDGQLGRRSQTRPVGGRGQNSTPSAPRSTFSPEPSHTPKPTAPGRPPAAPRSVFQQAGSAHPPTSTDPDKTVKRPYPTAPSAWGQTLPLGDLLPGESSALFPNENGETTKQVPRSAFAKTLLHGDGMTPPTPPDDPPPAEPEPARTGYSPPPEPLTVPSNRPAPAPWQQSRAAAPKGTILMPGSPVGQEPTRSVAVPQPEGAASPQPRPEPKVAQSRAVPVSAKQTLPLGSTAISAEAPTLAVRPEPPAAAATAPIAPKKAAPAAPATAPARAAASAAKNVSEPLQLHIAERDVLQRASMAERPVLPRSRGPLIAALLIAAGLVLGGIAWFSLNKEPAVSPEPTRNDAVTVPAAQAPAAAPVQPATVPAAQPAQPQPPAATAQPASQPAAPAAPTNKVVAQPPAAPVPAREQTAAPAKPKTQSAASRRRAERRAAKRQAAEDTGLPVPAGDVPEDVGEAREALRELESEPVMKIKPTPTEEAAEPDFPPLPEPPEPPPAPEGE